MNAPQPITPVHWHSLNYQQLLSQVDALKQRLLGLLSQEPSKQQTQESSQEQPQHPSCAMLDRLSVLFDLSEFERQLLLLCVAVELDAEIAPLYQQLIQQPQPNLALALTLFAGDCSALAPQAPLRQFNLVELNPPHTSLIRGALTLSEWTLLYLLAEPVLDPLLTTCLHPIELTYPLLASQQQLAEQIANQLTDTLAHDDESVIPQLVGATFTAACQVAALVAQATDQLIYQFDLYHLPNSEQEQQRLLLSIERELIAQQGIVLVNVERLTQADSGQDPYQHQFQLRNWLACLNRDVPGACLLYGHRPLLLSRNRIHPFEINTLTDAEQLLLWQHHLPQSDCTDVNNTLLALNHQYQFNAQQIRSITQGIGEQHGTDLSTQLWQRCREQTRQNLQGLAQVVPPGQLDWDDLVLPKKEKQTLASLVSQAQLRYQVYQQWGFGQRMSYGLGICALFAGSSGTGKTLSARMIASALKLDLYHVDLSQVVDKYIGETEKRLERIFTAAENSGAVLLFDEADALFGSRTKVQDSKDRYANMGVSFLLQRMERYAGLSILTTNARSALDSAFTRRIRFIVNFPFPAQEQRQQIWQRAMPPQAPTEGIDYSKLARLTLAGGSISNIVLQAAFMAAEAQQPINMSILRTAVQQEYIKAEKALDQKLIDDWLI